MSEPRTKRKDRKNAGKPSADNDEQVDRDVVEKNINSKFRVLFSAVKKQSREIEKRYDMSAAALWTLVALQRHPGLRVSDVAQLIDIHSSNASNLLDLLEERRLVRRERGQEDQRIVQLHLTPTGQAFVSDLPESARNVVSVALAGLSPKGLVTFNQGLEEMVDNLKVPDTGATKTPIAEI